MTSQLIDRALRSMQSCRVVLLGDYMLDTYLYGETVRVSREAPVLVVRQQRSEHRLGGAANTAANLASLGLHTELIGTIGDDNAGQTLRHLLQATGAQINRLRTQARGTAVKTRIFAGAFGTGKQQVLRLDEEPAHSMPEMIEQQLISDLNDCAAEADVLVVSDYGMGTLTPKLIATLQRLGQQGKTVCVDSRYQLPAYVGVTAVTPNIPEAEQMLGRPIVSQSDVERAGQQILQNLACDTCLLTQGRLGMTLFTKGEPSLHTDIVGEQEVTDVTGAGDTVLATLAGSLAAGLGFINAMRLANCAAGVVVGRVGTASIRPVDLAQAALKGGIGLTAWD